MKYHELSIEERATIQVGRLHDMSQRAITQALGRNRSTISSELWRNTGANGIYHAPTAQGHHEHPVFGLTAEVRESERIERFRFPFATFLAILGRKPAKPQQTCFLWM